MADVMGITLPDGSWFPLDGEPKPYPVNFNFKTLAEVEAEQS